MKQNISLMKYIWLVITETGNNSAFNRMEVIFLKYKGSVEVNVPGLIWESHSQWGPGSFLSFHLPNLWLLTSKLPQVQDRNWNSNPHIFILVENRTKQEIKKSSPATQSCFMEPFKKTHSTTFPSYWPELNHMATPRCKGGWNANICLGTLPHQIKFEFSCWGIRILYSTCQFYHKLLLKH